MSAEDAGELFAPGEAPQGYAAAMAELDDLLAEIDDDQLDIDELSSKVERAAKLVRYCRARIDDARVNVERVVNEFGGDVQA